MSEQRPTTMIGTMLVRPAPIFILLIATTPPASAAASAGVCDIFASGGTPCVAAHSLTRALFSLFSAPLYQVTRVTDNQTIDVSPIAAGGVADISNQDAFCSGAHCEISIIYDQSGSNNHLTRAPAGGNDKHPTNLVNASRWPITLAGGHKVYGGYFEGNMGYRIDETVGVAKGNDPETLYMVTDGTHVNSGCCFDCTFARPREPKHTPDPNTTPPPPTKKLYLKPDGNAESNNNDDGAGVGLPCRHRAAKIAPSLTPAPNSTDDGGDLLRPLFYLGSGLGQRALGHGGSRRRLVGGRKPHDAIQHAVGAPLCVCHGVRLRARHSQQPRRVATVTLFPNSARTLNNNRKGGTNGFALKGGDATTGALSLLYDGPRPRGYQPMKKQGSIILGIGGDSSNQAIGTFYEGAITAGYSSDGTDAQVAANAAGYGQ